MEFRLDAGQVELQETVARFAANRFPLDSISTREQRGVDRDEWSGLAALGVFGLLLAEDVGGSGLGTIDGAIVFEQLGSHLVPGPVLWTVIGAGLVDGAAAGELIVGGVDGAVEPDGSVVVENAADLDVLLVVDDEGVVAHRRDDLGEPEPLTPLDPLTPVGQFPALGAGTPVGDSTAAAELRLLGTVLTAASLVGVASRAVEVARSYALEREQFGAPIGSFQAIKHLLADMYVRSTLAQSEAYAAAVVQDRDTAAAAKLLAAEAAITNAGTAIQVLGGMGFTWDMLPNFLLKRAWVLEQSFGSSDDHALHLGSRLG